MTQITIRGETFRVRRVPDLNLELARRGLPDRHRLLGIVLPGPPPEILIQRGEPREEASTLLHELLHAADSILGEGRVSDLEEILAPVLWRQGWRPFRG